MRSPAQPGMSRSQDCSEHSSGRPTRSSTVTASLAARVLPLRMTTPHTSMTGRGRLPYLVASGGSTSAAKSSSPRSRLSVTCAVPPLVT